MNRMSVADVVLRCEGIRRMALVPMTDDAARWLRKHDAGCRWRGKELVVEDAERRDEIVEGLELDGFTAA